MTKLFEKLPHLNGKHGSHATQKQIPSFTLKWDENFIQTIAKETIPTFQLYSLLYNFGVSGGVLVVQQASCPFKSSH
jgi:hypothetical protein